MCRSIVYGEEFVCQHQRTQRKQTAENDKRTIVRNMYNNFLNNVTELHSSPGIQNIQSGLDALHRYF